jgi:hypothetical protein
MEFAPGETSRRAWLCHAARAAVGGAAAGDPRLRGTLAKMLDSARVLGGSPADGPRSTANRRFRV